MTRGNTSEGLRNQAELTAWLRQAIDDTADPSCGDALGGGNIPPSQAAGTAVSEAADTTASADDDSSFPEQCLGCESLMVQLRDTSDEAHQLRICLAEATEALQVTPARSQHAPCFSLMQSAQHEMSLL